MQPARVKRLCINFSRDIKILNFYTKIPVQTCFLPADMQTTIRASSGVLCSLVLNWPRQKPVKPENEATSTTRTRRTQWYLLPVSVYPPYQPCEHGEGIHHRQTGNTSFCIIYSSDFIMIIIQEYSLVPRPSSFINRFTSRARAARAEWSWKVWSIYIWGGGWGYKHTHVTSRNAHSAAQTWVVMMSYTRRHL